MRKIEEVNADYQQICTILGDITVKIQGLKNQKAEVFKKLEQLDAEAASIFAANSAPKEANVEDLEKEFEEITK